ncbi:hypothetical protein [Sediminitomix flava]|uniref:Uncharacterized protein n=1 Tax=Sediminitomix flava TaxID=379075 RepID=A0A315YS10_SEDFL|nr:hypothetical protein [Sediminitomix flava]PWJ30951.1 hypothetical protein BC781_1262 [Sediminitomix flava]
MKLNCPKCESPIQSEDVNTVEDFAICMECDEYYQISEDLMNNESYKKTVKPLNTNITILELVDKIKCDLQPKPYYKFLSNTFPSFLVFISLVFMFSPDVDNRINLIVKISLIYSLIAIIKLFLKYDLRIDEKDIEFKTSIFGIGIKKNRKTKWFKSIEESEVYDSKSEKSSSRISLKFKYQDDINFGSNLEQEERRWLISELEYLINKMKFKNYKKL